MYAEIKNVTYSYATFGVQTVFRDRIRILLIAIDNKEECFALNNMQDPYYI